MPKEKTLCVQFILVLALSFGRLSREGIPHMKHHWAGYESNNRHSCKEGLALDTVTPNENIASLSRASDCTNLTDCGDFGNGTG